ncbi:Cupredoxin [Dendryphion nanum]|uniref:Cupredoxin n=1 Tax=Dendryphion nanum TaxID=256645 RepID=A0A9P9D9V3_9PLEO|nr:Cupredoxin [Dendryphion nanum]
MLFTTLIATAFAGAALAEDISVAVGLKNGSLIFNPESITAKNGDNIHFKFWPKNHSVAQSAFASPCQPLANGIFSGYVPTTDAEKVATTQFKYTVTNESQPIWLYCSQGRHCQAGMVAVINPPTSGQNTLARFKQAAASAENNTGPAGVSSRGGELLNVTSTSPSGSGSASSPTSSPGAAAAIHPSTFAVSGVLGMFAYFLL